MADEFPATLDLLRSSNRIPLVNLNVIGQRPEPIVPSGVWIEIQGNEQENEAEENARFEQDKLTSVLKEKEYKLKKFQKDVQKRVKRAAIIHKQKLMDDQIEKMEVEQRVLYRSAKAAEKHTPKKNHCLYNSNPIAINCCGQITAAPPFQTSYKTKQDPVLDICVGQAEHLQRKARKKLAGKLIVAKNDENRSEPNNLPGGLWGLSSTRDKNDARIAEGIQSNRKKKIDDVNKQNNSNERGLGNLTLDGSDDDKVQTILAAPAPHDVALASVQEAITSGIKSRNVDNMTPSLRETPLVDMSGDLEFAPIHASAHIPSVVHFKAENSSKWESKEIIPTDLRHVLKDKVIVSRSFSKKEPRTISVPTEKIEKPQRLEDDLPTPPLIYPGAIAYEQTRANQKARWLSRRVFADAEREQSREQARIKIHKQRIEKIRAEKELEREIIEAQSRDQVMEAMVAKQRQLEQSKEQERKVKRKREKKIKQQKISQRFSAAIKSQLREKTEQNKLELPPLCMCGPTFWDTDPDTCANNCIFYKNPKAYNKALEAVLKAVERNLGPFHKDRLQMSSVALSLITGKENLGGNTARSNFTCSTARSYLTDNTTGSSRDGITAYSKGDTTFRSEVSSPSLLSVNGL